MRLDVSVQIPFPRVLVFSTYRDRLPELVPYLPNVRGIAVSSRTEQGALTTLVNRWKGGGEIPAAVRKFLSAELLEWDDHATWDAAAFTTRWRTVVPAFRDAVDATGTNTFLEQGPASTLFTIAGELKVDAGKIRGVPRILSGAISPVIEGFLVNAIKPNLVAVTEGLKKYLQSASAAQ